MKFRISAALVAVVGSALLTLCGGPLPDAQAVVPPPTRVLSATKTTFALAEGLEAAGSAWRAVHDGRRFAAGMTEGWPDSEVRASTRLAHRYSRTRARAARSATRAHRRLARELGRWDGSDGVGFYSPGGIGAMTRAIAQAEDAGRAASELIGFIASLEPRSAAFDAFVAASDDVSTDIRAADSVCTALVLDLQDRCVDLTSSLRTETHATVMGRRLAASARVNDDAAAAESPRSRAALLARAYRMLGADYRRARSFLAREHSALRRLVTAAPDGSIVNGTGESFVVYEIRATLVVRINRSQQTSDALATEDTPGAFPLLVPADAAPDGFDYLVFDRDALAVENSGVVRLTYVTSIGDVRAAHLVR